ncbi:hypothetical protein BC629DRAFT_1444902 [Irpex lacteus]|nr:hypothetical protein BC629DRAFT_1444902 [Irpex lacteus]
MLLAPPLPRTPNRRSQLTRPTRIVGVLLTITARRHGGQRGPPRAQHTPEFSRLWRDLEQRCALRVVCVVFDAYAVLKSVVQRNFVMKKPWPNGCDYRLACKRDREHGFPDVSVDGVTDIAATPYVEIDPATLEATVSEIINDTCMNYTVRLTLTVIQRIQGLCRHCRNLGHTIANLSSTGYLLARDEAQRRSPSPSSTVCPFHVSEPQHHGPHPPTLPRPIQPPHLSSPPPGPGAHLPPEIFEIILYHASRNGIVVLRDYRRYMQEIQEGRRNPDQEYLRRTLLPSSPRRILRNCALVSRYWANQSRIKLSTGAPADLPAPLPAGTHVPQVNPRVHRLLTKVDYM